MILFLRFRRATLLLTRGISRSLRHQQALEASFVGVRDQRGLAQVSLPLGMLLGQDMALVRVVPSQPARAGQPDALAQRTLGFLFGHRSLPALRGGAKSAISGRSEEHTSELQSQSNLVCRLLLEKKKKERVTYAHT